MASIINKLLGKDTEDTKTTSNVASSHGGAGAGTNANTAANMTAHSTTQGHHPTPGMVGQQGDVQSETTAERLTSDFGGARSGEFGGQGAPVGAVGSAAGGRDFAGPGNVLATAANTGATGTAGNAGVHRDSADQRQRDEAAAGRASQISGSTGTGSVPRSNISGSTLGGNHGGQRAEQALSSATGHHSSATSTGAGLGSAGTGTSQIRSDVGGAAGLSGDRHHYGSESTGQRIGEGVSAATSHHHGQGQGHGQDHGLSGASAGAVAGNAFGSHLGGQTHRMGGGGFDGAGEGYNDSSMGAGVASDVGGASKLEGEELGSYRGEQGYSQGGDNDAANRK